MYFCTSCKSQFNDGMAVMGRCPYCGNINHYSKRQSELKEFTIHKKSDRIKEIKDLIKRLKG